MQLPALAREQLYRQIVENAHEGIWVADRSGQTIFVNDRMAAMLGYEVPEIIARQLADFVRDDEEPGGSRYAKTGFREVRLRARSGEPVWALLNISPLFDRDGRSIAVVTTAVDITLRKAFEEALRQSEQRLKTIFETEPACVKLVSADGRLIEMNRAGLQMIDAEDLSQVMGQEIASLVHPADRARFVDAMRAASEGQHTTTEFRVVGLRGTQRWLETHAVPFDRASIAGGHSSVVLGVTHDLTERKLLENELHQSQKLEAVGRLAGGVAHDFNNLMTAILGYCSFAEMQVDRDSPVRAELAQIRAAGERAVALTTQLLAFSRKQILKPRVIDVNETVAGLLSILPRIIGERIATSTELDPELLRVRADPTQLEQVLLNLALNARDAMPEGGSLTIRTANEYLVDSPVAKVREFAPGPFVRLDVIDTGTGMDAETQSRIFEPFFTTKGAGRGTGLGLATVYGIVKQSRGFIVVRTALGHGTTFTIHLPATTAEVEAVPLPRTAQPRGGEETILLVEDQAAVRDLERRSLEGIGYRVLVAADPIEAIDIAVVEKGKIDLLLTDVIMPHMTGPQLAAEIAVRWPSIRTLFVSGYSEGVPAAPGGRESRLLRKPFTPAQLVAAVRSALDEP